MTNFDQVALFLIILIPLVGSLLTAFMPKDRPRDSWYFAVFVSALTLISSVLIFFRYDYGDGGFQFGRTFDWLGQSPRRRREV